MLTIALTGCLATSIAFFDAWHWRADLFAQLRPQYCVWLCLGALGAFILKHRFAFVLAVVGLVANAVALAPHAMPWREADDKRLTGHTWTFVSVNLLHGNLEVSRVTSAMR